MFLHIKKAVCLLPAVLILPCYIAAGDEIRQVEKDSLMLLFSPLAGSNHSQLKQGGPHEGKLSKTAPEYGLFALAVHPNFAVNDFLFLTEASGDTDILGNFFHINLYGDQDNFVTWNVGAGHLYHKIKPAHGDVDVNVGIARIGPVFNYKPWGLSINPYIGASRERVSTRFGGESDTAVLYGVSADWRWRMINLNCKYYYQDTRKKSSSFNNFHLRLTGGITQGFGLALRLDHIEQAVVKNTSILAGPVFVF